MIAGPRATGRRTTARRYAATVIRLDRPVDAAAAAAIPDSVIGTLEETGWRPAHAGPWPVPDQ